MIYFIEPDPKDYKPLTEGQLWGEPLSVSDLPQPQQAGSANQSTAKREGSNQPAVHAASVAGRATP